MTFRVPPGMETDVILLLSWIASNRHESDLRIQCFAEYSRTLTVGRADGLPENALAIASVIRSWARRTAVFP